MRRLHVVAQIAIVLAGTGCATGPMPGGAGEVSGPLRSIEFYTKPPQWEESFRASSRDRIFSSDRTVYVLAEWILPGPGEYVSKLLFRTPAGSTYRESEYTFQAKTSSVLTAQGIDLPQGEAARWLGGRWEVEVALDGRFAGRRRFTFEPSSIRLRTDKKLVILHGKADATNAPGDWIWMHEYGIREQQQAALTRVGVVLRDEFARRFPHVDGPQDASAGSEGTVILTPSLHISPNPSMDSRLQLEVVDLPTKTIRKFDFKTSAGVEGKRVHFDVAAADLAVRAASSSEVLEFLVSVLQAVPE